MIILPSVLPWRQLYSAARLFADPARENTLENYKRKLNQSGEKSVSIVGGLRRRELILLYELGLISVVRRIIV